MIINFKKKWLTSVQRVSILHISSSTYLFLNLSFERLWNSFCLLLGLGEQSRSFMQQEGGASGLTAITVCQELPYWGYFLFLTSWWAKENGLKENIRSSLKFLANIDYLLVKFGIDRTAQETLLKPILTLPISFHEFFESIFTFKTNSTVDQCSY